MPMWVQGAGSPGFTWRSGRERTTTGIWMFSKAAPCTPTRYVHALRQVRVSMYAACEHGTGSGVVLLQPFVRTNMQTGQPTAVLLMDTQGMFDMQAHTHATTCS